MAMDPRETVLDRKPPSRSPVTFKVITLAPVGFKNLTGRKGDSSISTRHTWLLDPANVNHRH